MSIKIGYRYLIVFLIYMTVTRKKRIRLDPFVFLLHGFDLRKD